MGRETVLFKSEERKDLQSVCGLLRDLTYKIEQGKVVLRQGDNQVVLHIPETVVLEVKAEEEEGKNGTKKKLEIEIEWRVGGNERTGGNSSLSLG